MRAECLMSRNSSPCCFLCFSAVSSIYCARLPWKQQTKTMTRDVCEQQRPPWSSGVCACLHYESRAPHHETAVIFSSICFSRCFVRRHGICMYIQMSALFSSCDAVIGLHHHQIQLFFIHHRWRPEQTQPHHSADTFFWCVTNPSYMWLQCFETARNEGRGISYLLCTWWVLHSVLGRFEDKHSTTVLNEFSN